MRRVASTGQEGTGVYGNGYLRLGEVVKVVYPEDRESRSRVFIEYRVLVQHRDASSGAGKVYDGCVVASLFGGFADYGTFVLRDGGVTRDKEGLGYGSKVLVLCVNGEQASPVIVGGIRDERSSERGMKSLGQFLRYVYNGVEFNVDKDGQLKVTYLGATDAKGKTEVAPDDAGSGFSLDKDGSVSMYTHGQDAVLKLSRPDNIAYLRSPEGIRIGEATDAMLLGETYRNAQAQLHSDMMGKLTEMAATLGSAAVSLKAVSVLHIIPVVGPILAAPGVAAVALSLDAVAARMTELVLSLGSFERGVYLSEKNRSD